MCVCSFSRNHLLIHISILPPNEQILKEEEKNYLKRSNIIYFIFNRHIENKTKKRNSDNSDQITNGEDEKKTDCSTSNSLHFAFDLLLLLLCWNILVWSARSGWWMASSSCINRFFAILFYFICCWARSWKSKVFYFASIVRARTMHAHTFHGRCTERCFFNSFFLFFNYLLIYYLRHAKFV